MAVTCEHHPYCFWTVFVSLEFTHLALSINITKSSDFIYNNFCLSAKTVPIFSQNCPRIEHKNTFCFTRDCNNIMYIIHLYCREDPIIKLFTTSSERTPVTVPTSATSRACPSWPLFSCSTWRPLMPSSV